MNAIEAVKLAAAHKTIIPAFNIPYLPMVEPVTEAIKDENSVAMVQVARLEWEKFESQSPEAVAEEYFKHCKAGYTLLHLDHVPAIDEDQKLVEFLPLLERALKAGYQSIMVDGSRLPLDENIAVTAKAAELAAKYGAAVEAELLCPVMRVTALVLAMKNCLPPRRASPRWKKPLALPRNPVATGSAWQQAASMVPSLPIPSI